MATVEGIKRIEKLGKSIAIWGGFVGLLVCSAFLAIGGRVSLVELAILVGTPIVLGVTLRLYGWIVEGWCFRQGFLKSYRLILSVPLLLACVAGAFALWNHNRLLLPTPETESAFLRNYTPKQVIDRFREPRQSFSYGQSRGDAAGRVFVRHEAGFRFNVVLRSQKWMPLMDALRDDVLQQLAANGAEVFSQTGDPRNGFQFDYRVSKTFGSLTISPVAINPSIRRNMSLTEDMMDVTVKIEETERWFPKGASAIQVNFKNSVR